MLAASVSGVSLPSLKKVAWLMPPIITAIASAVESPPDGDFSATLPSSVEPERNSRQIEVLRHLADALDDDRDFLLGAVGQRQHDDVEATLERGGQFVDTLVAVV